MLKLNLISFMIRNNNKFFLGWLRQLNLFSTIQDYKDVDYILDMLYRNKVYNMDLKNQIRVYEKLSFIHHSISKDKINIAMKRVCSNIGKDNYQKVILAIRKNRLPEQQGFLSDILYSFMMYDKIKAPIKLQLI